MRTGNRMSEPATPREIAEAHDREFWRKENQKHIAPHFRLRKCARVVNAIAGGRECSLLDVGCGPGTLMSVLNENIHYYGLDFALHASAANLREVDILSAPISFYGMKFDIVVAQGLFEYVGSAQSQKFSEIAQLLREDGTFVVSYTNFSHRDSRPFKAFSNIQTLREFRQELERYFTVRRRIPCSHNWHGGQPRRRLVMGVSMRVNAHVPFFSPRLAVDYFFVCCPR